MKVWSCMIYLASILGMIRIICSNYLLMVSASQYLSMNTTISLLLKVAIYGLMVYQTYTLRIKRRNAIEVSDEIQNS